jgi:hypothetical protein
LFRVLDATTDAIKDFTALIREVGDLAKVIDGVRRAEASKNGESRPPTAAGIPRCVR